MPAYRCNNAPRVKKPNDAAAMARAVGQKRNRSRSAMRDESLRRERSWSPSAIADWFMSSRLWAATADCRSVAWIRWSRWDAGRPNARVNVLTQPRVRGYDRAIRTIREALHANYGFLDLWLFFPDADKAGRDAMRDLEVHVAALDRCTLMCCVARPELEIFACAGFRNQIPEAWDDVRLHPRMK